MLKSNSHTEWSAYTSLYPKHKDRASTLLLLDQVVVIWSAILTFASVDKTLLCYHSNGTS